MNTFRRCAVTFDRAMLESVSPLPMQPTETQPAEKVSAPNLRRLLCAVSPTDSRLTIRPNRALNGNCSHAHINLRTQSDMDALQGFQLAYEGGDVAKNCPTTGRVLRIQYAWIANAGVARPCHTVTSAWRRFLCNGDVESQLSPVYENSQRESLCTLRTLVTRGVPWCTLMSTDPRRRRPHTGSRALARLCAGCHYTVQWTTKYACLGATGLFGGHGTLICIMIVLITAAYFGGGTYYRSGPCG
jgi:hypothetical protein